jgi:hypothetical protein
MLIIPFEMPAGHERGPVVLVLILEKENLDRMRQADPFDVHLSAYRRHMPVERAIKQLDIVIAYEEDVNKLLEFKNRDDIGGLLRWLERGRKIVAGDVLPPVPLRKN